MSPRATSIRGRHVRLCSGKVSVGGGCTMLVLRWYVLTGLRAPWLLWGGDAIYKVAALFTCICPCSRSLFTCSGIGIPLLARVEGRRGEPDSGQGTPLRSWPRTLLYSFTHD